MEVICATHYSLIKFDTHHQIKLFISSTPKLQLYNSTPIHFKRFKLRSKNTETDNYAFKGQGFSMLEVDPPWESGNVWSTMGLYFFSLHIPLSFGGLSVVAYLLHLPNLDPQTKAVAILVIETLELFCALLLLQFTAKHNNFSFFQSDTTLNERNWMLTALLGFLILVLAMFLSSFLPDELIGTKDVSDQTVKEILLNNNVSQTSCALVYCIVAPLLEEMVYRRFLLTSLAQSMEWYQAVMISSLIFSASHISAENFTQLVLVGIVLGCSYCWTGDLRSSILMHSMYNALTLLMTVLA